MEMIPTLPTAFTLPPLYEFMVASMVAEEMILNFTPKFRQKGLFSQLLGTIPESFFSIHLLEANMPFREAINSYISSPNLICVS